MGFFLSGLITFTKAKNTHNMMKIIYRFFCENLHFILIYSFQLETQREKKNVTPNFVGSHPGVESDACIDGSTSGTSRNRNTPKKVGVNMSDTQNRLDNPHRTLSGTKTCTYLIDDHIINTTEAETIIQTRIKRNIQKKINKGKRVCSTHINITRHHHRFLTKGSFRYRLQ